MMTEQPLVSIVMNCYNSDRFLKEAIDSVYAQSYSNWEIIFWDNASTDDSALIAKSYDHRLRYFLAEETTPLGEARNLALQEVSGKYVAFLDCDDLYLADKLEKQVLLMEASDYAMCYGSAIIIDQYGKEIRKYPVKNSSGYIFGQLLIRYEINMQSVMVRRSILENNSIEFEQTLKYSPDHNLFMRIASNHMVGVIHDYIVQYRVLDNSLSRKSIDIAAYEVGFTLDQIAEQSPELREQFAVEFDAAYQKLHYYESVAAIYGNDRKRARKEMHQVMYSKIEYFILYLLLFSPIPNRVILKILGR